MLVTGGLHLVFQASWAAFTLILAVSSVKGGHGGLASVAIFSLSALLVWWEVLDYDTELEKDFGRELGL